MSEFNLETKILEPLQKEPSIPGRAFSAIPPPTATLSPLTEPIGGSLNSNGQQLMATLLDEVARPAQTADEETDSPYTNKRWEASELKPRHREMMRRIVEGGTYEEIAADMGLSYQTVMLVCSSAIFKAELAIMEETLNLNVIRRAEELSNEALDKLKRLMRVARSESLQASCAEKVLGIAGYSKIEKKQIAVVSGEDVIKEMNRQRREASIARQSRSDPGSEVRDSIVEAEIAT